MIIGTTASVENEYKFEEPGKWIKQWLDTKLLIMTLTQTLKNHLIVSRFHFIVLPMFFIVWWYFDFNKDALLIFGIYHLFFSLLALFLHIEYFMRNKGEEIEITGSHIIVRKNRLESRYRFDELSEITIYKPASLDRNRIPFSAMEYYYFASIATESGNEIIITCLMAPNIEKSLSQLSGITIHRRKGLAVIMWR